MSAPTGYTNAGSKVSFTGKDTQDQGTLNLSKNGKSKSLENKYSTVLRFEKKWNDQSNKYSTRPAYVRAQLYVALVAQNADGSFADNSSISGITNWVPASTENLSGYSGLSSVLQDRISADNKAQKLGDDGTILLPLATSATQMWSTLPSTTKDASGTLYKLFYRMAEVLDTSNTYAMGRVNKSDTADQALKNYTASNSDTASFANNRYVSKATNALKTTSLEIEKLWSDENNYFELEGSATFKLSYSTDGFAKDANGSYTNTTDLADKFNVTITNNDNWKKTITGLPACDANGADYQWQATEVSGPEGYTFGNPSNTAGTETTADKTVITNTLNTAKIKLVKQGEGVEGALKNVTFKVTGTNRNATKPKDLFTWSSDDNGTASIAGDAVTSGSISLDNDGYITGLPEGTYTFTEVRNESANPALSQEMIIVVTVDKDGKVAQAQATTKVDGNANTTSYGSSQSIISTTTSDGASTITVTDPKAKVTVTLNKTTTGSASVDGTKFDLYKYVDGSSDAKQNTEPLAITGGKVSLGQLEVGSYYLQETEASATTHLQDGKKFWFKVTNVDGGKVDAVTDMTGDDAGAITVDSDKSTLKIENDAFAAKVQFSKKDKTTQKLVPGATYKLQYSATENGTYTDEITGITSTDGMYTANNLSKKGFYKLFETAAPAGYLLPSDALATFEVTDRDQWSDTDQNYVRVNTNNTVSEEPYKSTITWTKVDANNDDATISSAASFELKNSTTDETFEVANNNGVYTATVTSKGDYTLTETAAPTGYSDVATGGTQVASFTLIDGDYDKTLTLNSGTEKTTAGNPISYTDGKWSATGLQNTRKTGALSLLKVDSADTSKGLAGAVFTLTGPNNFSTTLTTNEQGVASIDGLAWGEYTLTETQAPTGYTNKGWAPKTFAIDANNAGTTISYQGTEGSIKNVLTELALNKVDASGSSIDGATLTLTDANNTEVLTWSRANGEVSISQKATTGAYVNLKVSNSVIYGLPAGTYTLTETTTPEAYLTAAPITFSVAADGSVSSEAQGAVSGTTVTMTDQLAKANVGVAKAIADGENGSVEGNTFTLYKKNTDGSYVATGTSVTTDVNGVATFNDLEVGDYYFEETASSVDTALSSAKHYFTVTHGNTGEGATVVMGDGSTAAPTDGNAIVATNNGFTSTIQFKKIDGYSGQLLSGGSFALEDELGQPVVTFERNDQGYYVAKVTKKGTYHITETAAPVGYELPSGTTLASITLKDGDAGQANTLDGSTLESVGKGAISYTEGFWGTGSKATGSDANKGLKNTRSTGSVTITKVDDLGTALEGVQFRIVGTEGEAVDEPFTATLTTGADGKASVDKLPWGTYKVYETKTVTGHVQDWASDAGKEIGTFTIGNVAANDGSPAFVKEGQISQAGTDSTSNEIRNVRTQVGLGKNFAGDVPTTEGDDTVLTLTDKDGVTVATYTRYGKDKTVRLKLADGLTSKDAYKYAAVEQDITTKEDVIKGLPAGTYTLTETATPAAYLTASPISITVAANGSVTTDPVDAASGTKVTMNNTLAKAGVELAKTVTGGNNALAQGATFGLYQQLGETPADTDKQVGQTYTLGEDLKISVSDLGIGAYYFKELSAPAGTHLDSTPLVFTVSHGNTGEGATVTWNGKTADKGTDGTFKLSMNNDPFVATITWTKVDGSANDAPITSDTTFTLVDTTNNKSYEVTGKDGVYSATVATKGTYVLTETQAPTGYEAVNAEVAKFTLADADYNSSLKLVSGAKTSVGDVAFSESPAWSAAGLQNTRKTGALSLLKVDSADTSVGLEGAVFSLVGNSGQAEGKTYTLTTDADGTAGIDGLLWGEYTLTETQAPAGYTNKGWAPKTFTIDANNAGTTISYQGDEGSIKNVLSELQLNKIDDQSTPQNVQGAVLTLKDANGTEVLTWTRGDSGVAITLATGITENATYKYLKHAGETIYGLPAGTYTLTETVTPAAYVTAAQASITIADDGTVGVEGSSASAEGNKVSVTDQRAKVDVKVQKTIAGGASGTVAGVVFDLYDATSNAKLQSATTGADGVATFKDVYVGSYYVQESAAPYDVVLDTTKKLSFEVTNNNGLGGIVKDATNNTVMFENTAFNAGISFKKFDSVNTDMTVPGAVFKLKFTPEGASAAQDTLIDVTDNDGTYTATGLKKGNYELIEVSAPDGYYAVDNKTVATFTITNEQAGNNDIDINAIDSVSNVPVIASIEFSKLGYVNENGEGYLVDATTTTALAGAVFTLAQKSAANYNYRWEGIETATSDANGVVKFDKLPEGTYELTETEAPDVYHERWSGKYTITVDREGKVSVDPGTLDAVVNDFSRQTLNFKKVADTDSTKVIAGATYEIYRVGAGGAADTLLGQRTTDASGQVSFEGLLPNESYRLHEASAPDGSMLSKEDVTVNFVAQEDGSFKLNIVNAGEANGASTATLDSDGNLVWNEPQTEYKFSKLDPSGKALAGATLEIRDSNGNVVKDASGKELKWTSSTEPYSVVGVLVAGQSYKLVETAAPAGYQIASPVEFTVTSDREDPGRTHTVTITMTDQKTPTTPAGGGSGSGSKQASKSTTASKLSQTGDQVVLLGATGALAVVAAGVAGGAAYALRRRRAGAAFAPEHGKHTR